ncbi:hig-anchoring scaffold protein isoform X2 [Oratosquilla oratoria]|uniref:hig-anchoring scaffold protein isoform X2 n=1 Tax=Oratosquilla oratoria TaxID=337810 RepID=UPI003F76145D
MAAPRTSSGPLPLVARFLLVAATLAVLLVAGIEAGRGRRPRYSYDGYEEQIDDESVEGKRIYKNPRNAPSDHCPRDEDAIKRTSRSCLRKCSSHKDCLSPRRVCICDGVCGMSCIKPDKECDDLENPLFGIVEISGNIVKSKATYKCQEGYHLIGRRERVCQADGTWSGKAPECKENLYCTDPPLIANARHNVPEAQTRFEVNYTLQYSCQQGYMTKGFSRAKCLLYNGTMQWFGPEIECIPKSCGDPGEIENGIKEGSCYTYSCRVTYHCRTGYEIMGLANHYCQHDGSWSPQALPSCEPVKCDIPANPANGKAIFITVSYNSVVTYTCNFSFMIVGPSTRHCGPDKKWSGDTPQCKPPCIVPSVEHGTINNKQPRMHVSHGFILQVVCEKNYELTYNNSLPACYNGTWSHYPHCEPARCKTLPARPRHGMVIVPKTDHGRLAKFRCRDGYRLNGSQTTECKYGNWTDARPRCEEVFCGFPGYLENGKVLLVGNMGMYDYRQYVKNVRNNRQIRYECSRGYYLVNGPPGSTCVAGRWSPEQKPQCIPNYHPRIRWLRKRSVNESEAPSWATVNESEALSWATPAPIPLSNTTQYIEWKYSESAEDEPHREEEEEEEEEEGEEYIFEEEKEEGLSDDKLTKGFFSPSSFSSPIAKEEMSLPSENDVSEAHATTTPSPSLLTSGQKNAIKFGSMLKAPLAEVYRLLRGEGVLHQQNNHGESSARLPFNESKNYNRVRFPRSLDSRGGFIVGYEGRGARSIAMEEAKHKKRLRKRGKHGKKGKRRRVPCEPIPNEPYLSVDIIRSGRDPNVTYSPGVRVKVTCLHGYGLNIGNKTAKCAHGKWKPMKPECVTLPCSVPPAPHGQYEFNGQDVPEHSTISHGEVVNFSCRSGYKVLGSETMRCWYGEWAVTGKSPDCQPEPCILPGMTHGKYMAGYKKNLTIIHGASVQYTCDEGWMRSHPKITCHLGNLTPAPPACVTPAQAADTSGAGHISTQGTAGLMGMNHHEADLTPGGDITINLTSSRKSCGPPTRIKGTVVFKNGRPLGDNDKAFPDGTDVTFNCITNGIGEKTTWKISCEDGSWVGRSGNKWQTATCEDDEDDVTGSNRTCVWRKSAPNVVTFFDDQQIMEDMVHFDSGTVLVSRCVDIGKYALNGAVRRRCNKGVWQGEKPTCFGLNQENDYALEKPPTILLRNMMGPMAQTNDGKLIIYPGTILHLECLWLRKYGTPHWNVTHHNRTRRHDKFDNDCKKPLKCWKYPEGWTTDPGRNSQLEYRLSLYHSHVDDTGTYTCITPPKHKHSVEIIVQAVHCPEIPAQKALQMSTTETKMNTKVTFSCDAGSTLVGSTEVTCLPSGNWSAPYPHCENIECPDIPVSEEVMDLGEAPVKVTVLSRTMDGRAVFSCPRGYGLTGEAQVVCQASGKWSSPPPKCYEVKCSSPEPPENGVVAGEGPFHAGDMVQITCRPNFMMEGKPFIVCQQTGEWSGETPKCVQACTYPGTIISGTMSSVKFYYAITDTITFSCSDGFRLHGARAIQCLDGGKWSAQVPTCLPDQ